MTTSGTTGPPSLSLPDSPTDLAVDPALAAEFTAYGRRVVAVEPGGTQPIPVEERFVRPRQLWWTWTSPNLEFATVFVGFLGVAYFGLSFWQAAVAIVIGNGLGALGQYALSPAGARTGLPQLMLGRLAFGRKGSRVPSTLMIVSSGIGWFAVNSLSGAFALAALTSLPPLACLVIVVVVQVAAAAFGHNFVQAFERWAFPVLAVVFGVAVVMVVAQADLSAPASGGTGGGTGGFLLTVAASFGYVAGWTPYAADYSRYMPPTTSPRTLGLAAAGGLFTSTTVLGLTGAASVSVIGAGSANPVADFTGALPGPLAALTLLAVVLGSCAANAVNVYSSGLGVLALGVRVGGRQARALTATLLGVAGGVLAAFGISDAGATYEAFLLVVAYWLGPWLGVLAADWLLRRPGNGDHLLADPRRENIAGPVALLGALVVSVVLFSNQTAYTGPLAAALPQLGDVTFIVGFVLAALGYTVLARRQVSAEAR